MKALKNQFLNIYIYRPINLPRFRFKVREFPDKVSLYRFRSTWLAAGE